MKIWADLGTLSLSFDCEYCVSLDKLSLITGNSSILKRLICAHKHFFKAQMQRPIKQASLIM